MADEPRIRASYTKLALKAVRALESSERDRAYAELGHLRSRVGEAGILEWLPAWVHVGVADAIQQTLDRQRARALWRDLMLQAFDRRLLKPLVRGTTKLHGERPPALLRRTPQAYALVFRNCGRVEVDVGDDDTSADLRFTEMPALLFDSDALLDSYAANCEAILRYVNVDGHVGRSIEDARSGTVTFQLRWRDGG